MKARPVPDFRAAIAETSFYQDWIGEDDTLVETVDAELQRWLRAKEENEARRADAGAVARRDLDALGKALTKFQIASHRALNNRNLFGLIALRWDAFRTPRSPPSLAHLNDHALETLRLVVGDIRESKELPERRRGPRVSRHSRKELGPLVEKLYKVVDVAIGDQLEESRKQTEQYACIREILAVIDIDVDRDEVSKIRSEYRNQS